MSSARDGAVVKAGARRGRGFSPGVITPVVALAVFAVAIVLASVAAPLATASPGQGAQRRAPAPRPNTPRSPTDWTVYHGAPDGAGVASAALHLSAPTRAWRSPKLDGAIYGEPLEAAGRVIVATEDDTVYALAADSGAVLWSTHVAAPVPAGELPCGNISPAVGITGTPVIDLARSEVFAVADELSGGHPRHRLVGLDLYTGALLLNRSVDPPGAHSAALLQRTGLALADGRVVFGFGGNYGDCGAYRGWVVSVPANGRGRLRRYATVPLRGGRRGAVWMGGAAPEVDRSGDIWVATGNGAVSGAYDGSDSVIELRPTLERLGLFAPSDWASDNAADGDLGSTAPALLADGDIVQVGKSATAYLLSGSRLGGVGGEISSTPACDGTDADGGNAVLGDVVYVACQSGVEALVAGSARVSARWDAQRTVGARSAAGAVPDGPPVIAAGLVWSVGGGTLFGLAQRTGDAVVRLFIGSNANDFPTPAVADGLLLVTGGGGGTVVAFAGAEGLPPSPTPPPGNG
jgi:outer membrane protein assembly factor BamB